VAGRECRDERLLWVDSRLAAQVGRVRRRCHSVAAVKGPGVVPAVGLVGELVLAAAPADVDNVLRHAIRPPEL
jgi:hypothetical protein